MAITGLVITLSDEPRPIDQTLAELATDPRLELGECRQSTLAAVLTTASAADDKKTFETIRQIKGVTNLAIAVVHFDDGGADDGEDDE